MLWIDGLSECWWLSASCKADWEAWSAIGAGLAVAVAMFTSHKAHQVATESAANSRSQLAEMQGQREQMAVVILSLLAVEIGGLPARTYLALVSFCNSIEWGEVNAIKSRELLIFSLDEFSSDLISSAEGSLDRLHTLPDGVGHQIAGLVASVRATSIMARDVRAGLIEGQSRDETFTYRGSTESFAYLQAQVFTLIVFATSVSRDVYKSLNVSFQPSEEIEKGLAELEAKFPNLAAQRKILGRSAEDSPS